MSKEALLLFRRQHQGQFNLNRNNMGPPPSPPLVCTLCLLNVTKSFSPYCKQSNTWWDQPGDKGTCSEKPFIYIAFSVCKVVSSLPWTWFKCLKASVIYLMPQVSAWSGHTI